MLVRRWQELKLQRKSRESFRFKEEAPAEAASYYSELLRHKSGDASCGSGS